MNHFLKVFAVFLVCLMFGSGAFSLERDRKPYEKIKKEFVTDLKTKLALSDEQSQKIEAILSESKEKMTMIWDDSKQEKTMGLIRQERELTESKINDLLTNEQREKFKTFKSTRKEKMQSAIQRRVVENLTDKLALTVDQQDQLKKVLSESHHRINIATQNKSGNESEIKATLDTIRHETDDKIAQLLTPEQKDQFRKMRDHQMRFNRRPKD